jgi:Na+-driven multidrug efflux pump
MWMNSYAPFYVSHFMTPQLYIVMLPANAALNWVFIYDAALGFVGAYIATCIVSIIQLAWFLYLLACLVRGFPFSGFSWQWLTKIALQLGAEWGRLLSWQAEGLLILILLASKVEWLPVLSAFSVISEFSALLLMPLIALMRTSAMQIAAINPGSTTLRESWLLLKSVRAWACVITAVFGISLIFLSNTLGIYAYHLEAERLLWWNTFLLVYGIVLPCFAYSHLIHGCYHACGNFSRVAITQVVVTWSMFMPLVWVALHQGKPLMFFIAFALKEVLVAIWLRCGVSREPT